jgi:hypothetical protein
MGFGGTPAAYSPRLNIVGRSRLMTPITNKQVSPPVTPGGDLHAAEGGFTEAAGRGQPAQEAVEHVRETTTEATGAVADESRSAARSVADESKNSAAGLQQARSSDS